MARLLIAQVVKTFRKARRRATALQLAVLAALLLCQRGVGAAVDDRPRRIGEALYLYLEHVGVELDCYFTIEEVWSKGEKSVDCLQVEGDENVMSIDQLVTKLNEQLKGVHAYQSAENPAIVHLVDARLEKEREYALAKCINCDYVGDMQGLVSYLHSSHINTISSQNMFLAGGWPGCTNDHITSMACSVRDTPVRRVLSDFVPLSHYSRILWLGDTKTQDGELNTKIQYLGPTSGPLRVFLWKDTATFEQHYLGEPGVSGVIPFDYGEIAYRNNPDPDKERVRVNLVYQATTFIDERLHADNPLQVRWAMLYLGKRKAKDGVPVLLKHIDYRYTTCGVLEESYPAVRALTMIGPPAADAALKELTDKDESDLRVRLLAEVLRAVRGRDAAAADVKKALAAPADDAQKARLELAMKRLQEGE